MIQVEHKTIVHAHCPLGCWDYYEVTFEPSYDEVYQVEKFQEACNAARGMKRYQEEIALMIADEISVSGLLTVTGKHGSNTNTVVRIEVER